MLPPRPSPDGLVCSADTASRGSRHPERAAPLFSRRKDEPPTGRCQSGVRDKRLTMTYSHMGKPHTTIGDASFHC